MNNDKYQQKHDFFLISYILYFVPLTLLLYKTLYPLYLKINLFIIKKVFLLQFSTYYVDKNDFWCLYLDLRNLLI